VPVATRVTVEPLATEEFDGLMLMPISAAFVTVRLAAGDAKPFIAAVTVAVPTVIPVATPVAEPIVVTAVLLDVQVTKLVRLAVEPSV